MSAVRLPPRSKKKGIAEKLLLLGVPHGSGVAPHTDSGETDTCSLFKRKKSILKKEKHDLFKKEGDFPGGPHPVSHGTSPDCWMGQVAVGALCGALLTFDF